MAKIAPIHGEMSGSIAGNTWSHNKGGQYVRQRRVPTNPTSLAQTRVRTSMSAQSSRWSTLSEQQREAWNIYAQNTPVLDSLGMAMTLSGHQTFVGINTLLSNTGYTLRTDPPSGTAPQPPKDLTAVANAGNPIVEFSFLVPPAGAEKFQVRWTGWLNPGQNPNINQTRVAGLAAQGAGQEYELTVAPPGDAGAVANFYVRALNNKGLASAYTKVRVVST